MHGVGWDRYYACLLLAVSLLFGSFFLYNGPQNYIYIGNNLNLLCNSNNIIRAKLQHIYRHVDGNMSSKTFEKEETRCLMTRANHAVLHHQLRHKPHPRFTTPPTYMHKSRTRLNNIYIILKQLINKYNPIRDHRDTNNP